MQPDEIASTIRQRRGWRKYNKMAFRRDIGAIGMSVVRGRSGWIWTTSLSNHLRKHGVEPNLKDALDDAEKAVRPLLLLLPVDDYEAKLEERRKSETDAAS